MVKSHNKAGGGGRRGKGGVGGVEEDIVSSRSGGSRHLPFSVTAQVIKLFQKAQHVGTEFDIPEDAYGAAMVALVRDMTYIVSPGQSAAHVRLGMMRIGMAIFTLVANIILQVSLLYFIHVFIVQTSVRKAQLRYQMFTAQTFDVTGDFNRLWWLQLRDKHELCQIAIMNKPFFLTILCLWTLVMVGEYRSSYRFYRNINMVPTVRRSQDQIVWTDGASAGHGECLCVGMTWKTRVAVYVFILMPKYAMLAGLLWDGSRWLATAMSLCDAIMSAVGLQFVLDIDEILFGTLLPQAQQQQVVDTNFFVEEKRKEWGDLIPKLQGQLILSAICAVGVFAWVFVFTWCLQDVLPYHLSFLREICIDYMDLSTSAVCKRFSAGGMNEKCYPRGG